MKSCYKFFTYLDFSDWTALSLIGWAYLSHKGGGCEPIGISSMLDNVVLPAFSNTISLIVRT